MSQYTSIGFSNPANAAHFIGLFEIAAAFSVLIRPVRTILLVFLYGKCQASFFTRIMKCLSGRNGGGSYGTTLALWFALDVEAAPSKHLNNIAAY